MMKDSQLDPAYLAEQMRLNPPSVRPSGIIFSGPVRLSFVNLFRPGKPTEEGGEGKYGATLLFPEKTDMSVFSKAWVDEAKRVFPKNWDASGQPVGLHTPFHDQGEKTTGTKPYAGFTPGAVYMAVSSRYKPAVVDANQNPVTDEARAYPGCWAFVGLNVYSYNNKKKGVGFGLQTVMIFADDQKLVSGGGDPARDFAHVQITAQSNIAAKFDALPGAAAPGDPQVLPAGGHVGTPGRLPVHPLPGREPGIDDLIG